MATNSADIIIAGGGLVGLTLAVALKAADADLEVLVVDPSSGAGGGDGRASAISAGAKRMLDALGIWPRLAAEAQPIEEVVVTDSRAASPVRPVFLTFEKAEGGRPVAEMVPNPALGSALREAAVGAGVELRQPDSVADFTVEPESVTVRLSKGEHVRARLLVAADGVRSRLREHAGIRTTGWDYPQTGLVGTIAHERPHRGRAEEHFLPAGSFAMLPLTGNRSSLVWVEPPKEAERLQRLDPDRIAAEIVRRIGHRFGAVVLEGPLQAHRLGLRVARDFVRPRFCLIGDAAHVIHPLAGQGLNLGFRDVAALAETIADARRLGLDFGAIDVLERYQAWRRFDTMEMAALTDALNRLFSNDNPLLRAFRDVGLGLVDRMPFLKRRLSDEAASRSGNVPRLLRGEAI